MEKTSNESGSSEEKEESKCTSLETEKNSDEYESSVKDHSFHSNESINISLTHSMNTTPLSFRRPMKLLSKKIDLETKSVNGRKTLKRSKIQPIQNEDVDTETDTDSLKLDKSKYRMQSVSNTTLTNVRM
jgi:hypothetical protein